MHFPDNLLFSLAGTVFCQSFLFLHVQRHLLLEVASISSYGAITFSSDLCFVGLPVNNVFSPVTVSCHNIFFVLLVRPIVSGIFYLFQILYFRFLLVSYLILLFSIAALQDWVACGLWVFFSGTGKPHSCQSCCLLPSSWHFWWFVPFLLKIWSHICWWEDNMFKVPGYGKWLESTTVILWTSVTDHALGNPCSLNTHPFMTCA